ncbi:hypothetical protein D5S17_12055 [Pseudonocardiaceae bacterium YIM PH 21723]|nr:hypothetical protein D5S17_12055 [Pseudonocardiaceae bacterium YIM PH 21723]
MVNRPYVRRSLFTATAIFSSFTLLVSPVSAEIPPAGTVVTSPNVQHVANLPKQPPMDKQTSFGTDIAFQDHYAFAGNYDGFVVYDIADPAKPKITSQVQCAGGQNDISVSGNLLYLSTDYPRTNDSCDSLPSTADKPDAWEGIKIFDISDKANPKKVAAVATDCGSHTHTLVPGNGNEKGKYDFLYISSYSPSDKFPNCKPPHNYLSVVRVPLDNPAQSKVTAKPVMFEPSGPPTNSTGCHDVTVFLDEDLAAGACMGDGLLLDISEREAPKVLDRVRDDKNFAFWHSATFSNDGTKVVYTDELGGGGAATCNEKTGPEHGADGIYEITKDRKLKFVSYYKIPRYQADTENCVAHNGSLIPVHDRDIMVQAWYQGGVSIMDFTDAAKPVEIGYFDRGPLDPAVLKTGGSWSAYYYNGYIYSSDIQKGLDVIKVTGLDTEDPGWTQFNAQTQQRF